jgi:hypothetical protein
MIYRRARGRPILRGGIGASPDTQLLDDFPVETTPV